MATEHFGISTLFCSSLLSINGCRFTFIILLEKTILWNCQSSFVLNYEIQSWTLSKPKYNLQCKTRISALLSASIEIFEDLPIAHACRWSDYRWRMKWNEYENTKFVMKWSQTNGHEKRRVMDVLQGIFVMMLFFWRNKLPFYLNKFMRCSHFFQSVEVFCLLSTITMKIEYFHFTEMIR